MSAEAVSVIVRSRDEAASIGRCLERLRQQELGASRLELIVVDSGSTDDTVEIARRSGAHVLEVGEQGFSFGGALNTGAQQASGAILVALSADAFAADPGWLARLLGAFRDPRVACASGERYGADNRPLTAAVRQDIESFRRNPQWGYSNAAGAFRAELWAQRGFREDLPGCEDKEWALHWLERGYQCVIDPTFVVEHDHTRDSLRDTFLRARREAAGYAAFLDLPPYRARQLAEEWWSRRGWHSSALRARLSPRRAARLLGGYAGRRAGAYGVGNRGGR